MKKSIILLMLFPLISYCGENDFKEEHMKILAELGLPLPDSGIKLVPRSSFGLTEPEMKIGLDELEQSNQKGYIEENSPRPMELLNFRSHAKLQFKQYAGISNDTSTNLRHDIKDLKLGFVFKGVPKSLMSSSLGIVPQGGFHEQGWSGAVQFFESKNIGTCAYAEMNVAVSHTATQVAIEDATYLINNKLTLMEVRGSKSSGFDYKIRWFDEISFHELECANMKYSQVLKDSIISLANQIDS